MSGISHVCHICSKSFTSNKGLKLHVYHHENKKNKDSTTKAESTAKAKVEKYACLNCPQRFVKLKEYKLHSETHNIESKPEAEPTAKKKIEKYKCSICSQSFVKLKEFRLHSKTHITEPTPEAGPAAKKKIEKYMCSICSQRFVKLKEFRLHSKTHITGLEPESSKAEPPVIITAPRFYKCPNCPKTFGKYGKFQPHLCGHIKFSDYSCEQCLTSFSSESLFDAHSRCDHFGKSYCCSICKKRFQRHMAFQHHKSKHMYQGPYKCPKCNASFSSISKRLRHIKNHVFKCAVCKIPLNKGEYLKHISETHGNVDASIPDLTSSEDDTSEDEENTREDSDVFPTSEYWSNTSNSEIEDTVCSPKQKPFRNCFICDKKVSKKCQDFHVKSHKVYKCSTCKKYFSTELKLKVHQQKKHVKESSNSLQICNPIQSSFVYASDSVVPAENQIVSNKKLEATQKNLGGLIQNNVPNVFQSISQSFKIDSVFSAKDLPLPQALQLTSESGVSNDIIDWSMDLEEKCKKLGYPISKELCEIIEKNIYELNSQIKNKDLLPAKRDIYRQIVGRLKNVLIENIEQKFKCQ